MITSTSRTDRLRWHRARLANVIAALDSALDAITAEDSSERAVWLVGTQLLWSRKDFSAALTELDAEIQRGGES